MELVLSRVEPEELDPLKCMTRGNVLIHQLVFSFHYVLLLQLLFYYKNSAKRLGNINDSYITINCYMTL